MRPISWLLAACVVFTGCSSVIVPAEGVARSPQDRDYAFTEVSGVRVWASGNEWDGLPAELPSVLTPIAVTLENRSGFKVRVTTRDFSLVGSSGFRYAALPPLAGEPRSEADRPFQVMTVDYHPAVPVRRPPYRNAPAPQRFWIARPHVHVYPGFPVWPHPWRWWDPAYQQRWYSRWPGSLPSEDMLERALPDGVLEDGGRISGFVYFQHLERERSAVLELSLHDAETGNDLGTARVPFDIRR